MPARSAPPSGWLPPKVALSGILLAAAFSAYHMARALYPEYGLNATLVGTCLAFITPLMAAALTFYLRQKLVQGGR